jgi:hypothetical protein
MNRRRFIGVFGALAFATLAACGGRHDSTPAPGPGSAPTTGSVRVTNSSAYRIDYIYLSPASSYSWGPDQLGSSYLYSGYSLTINGVPNGSYDLKAVASTGSAAYVYGFTVSGGATTPITVY